jgi:hypothetical protein
MYVSKTILVSPSSFLFIGVAPKLQFVAINGLSNINAGADYSALIAGDSRVKEITENR